MTDIANLAAWLRQQLDADVRRAMGLKSWAQGADFGVFIGDPIIGPFGGQSPIRNWGTGNDIAHLADPARVLRAVEAKRALLERCAEWISYGPIRDEPDRASDFAFVVAGETVLRLLAAEYADRPGYREEWKP